MAIGYEEPGRTGSFNRAIDIGTKGGGEGPSDDGALRAVLTFPP